MILVIDGQTDKLLGELNNRGNQLFWDDIRRHELTGLHTFNFTMLADSPMAEKLEKRNKFLTPKKGGGYYEFIIYDTETIYSTNEKIINGVATYAELNKQRIMNPYSFNSMTLKQLVDRAINTPEVEWEVGTVEYSGMLSGNTVDFLGAYDYLKKIQSIFNNNFEIDFRVEVKDNKITRFIDFVKKIGTDRNKEIVVGKDLLDIQRTVHADRIVTALLCLGPEREDGTRLSTTIRDEDSFQRWNRNNYDIYDIYEPESSNLDMTLEQLQTYGRTELNKRLDAVVSYVIRAAYLGEIYPHEDIYLGDDIRVKNVDMSPPLYANSRAIAVEESLTRPEDNKYDFGQITEYDVEEMRKVFKELQILYGAKIIRSDNPPEGTYNVIWVKTGGSVEIAHTWDPYLKRWIAMSGSFTWIKYAEDDKGKNMSDDSTDRNYIGFAYNQIEETPSDNPADYNWSLFRGPQGLPGPSGTNGEPTYTWVKYATSEDGENISDSPTGRTYMGIAYNKLTKNESSNPEDYEWSLIKGADAWHVEVISSNGNIFKASNISTVLEARVYKGGTEITDDLPASRFKWRRVSEDVMGDIIWNDKYFSGTKSVTVTTEDVNKRATFFCEILEK